MVKNIFLKSNIREIKKTFSRWISILAIVALGVGFFSGLKVTKETFLTTLNSYVDETNFYDLRLISTIGIESDEISELEKVDKIECAEGAYSYDFIYRVLSEDGSTSSERVCKLHSITSDINKLVLVSGSMPNDIDECVVDKDRFSEDEIGEYIYFTDSNSSDNLDTLKVKKYKIVGLVNSPLYINFERGSSSLGDGAVDSYIYILPSSFDSDIYTEAYLTLSDRYFVYSDLYEETISEITDYISSTFYDLSINRYQKIYDEALEEITDAEEEIESSKNKIQEAENTLNDKKALISSSEEEIKLNEEKINQGEEELNIYFKQYEDGLKLYNESLESLSNLYGEDIALSTLSSEKAKLDSTLVELNNKSNEIAFSREKIEESKEKISEAKEEINSYEKELIDKKKEILDAESDLLEAKKELEDFSEPTNYVLNRMTNIGYACFESDASIVEGIAKVFPIFFFIVAALVVMTTMSRMVNDERTQIGVLKALGYTKGKILSKYLLYSNSASILGGVFGFLVGSYLFPYVIWTAYGIMYGFSNISFVINIKLGIITTLIGALCSSISTIYSCYQEMKEVPAELIRPKAPKSGKKVFLEKITFIWNRMPFLHKVSARNIFRYKKRFIMMIIGICGCTALLVTGLGISDSIKNVVSKQYDDILTVDYIATINDDAKEEDITAFIDENSDIISSDLEVYTVSIDTEVNGVTKTINLVVLPKNDNLSDFINIHDTDKNILDLPNLNECILNYSFAKRNNINIGDVIKVKNSNLKEVELVVSNLCENYIYNYLYITEETYISNFGEFDVNSIYIKGNTGDNYSLNGASLSKSSAVSSISIISDFRTRVDKMMKAMDLVVLLVVFSAGALAFIVLYNLTNINISERIREIATLKVLGFYPHETLAYVSRENYVLTVISAIIGLPLGKILHSYVMSQIVIDMVSFDIHVTTLSYIISFVLTIVFAIFVNFFMSFKLKKINMAESLKSIE